MLSGTKAGNTRIHNRRVTMEVIRLQGPISRAEISRETGLTMPTISTITSELIDQGIVAVKGRRHGKRGQPAIDMEINADGGYSIGLHWDRDHIAAVLINLKGEIKYEETHLINYPPPEVTLPLVKQFCEKGVLEANISMDDIWGVGLAIPGPFQSLERELIFPADFPKLMGYPVKEKLSEILDMPVAVEHDITAAAIGEQFHHAEPTVKNFFYIYLGFGLGGGMIVNGFPYRGTFGNASHLSMIVSDSHGNKVYSGDIAALGHLYKLLEEVDISISSPAQLSELFENGNSVVMDWLEQCVFHLTPPIIAVEALLDPETIYFGGRLPDEMLEVLLDRLTKEIQKTLIGHQPIHRCQLLKATAGENSAAVGAATLPIYENMSPRVGFVPYSNT